MKGHPAFLVLVLLSVVMGSGQRAFAQQPLDKIEILGLILSGTPSQFVVYQVSRNGITSKADPTYATTLRTVGVSETFIEALRKAKVRKRKGLEPNFAVVEKSVLDHLARASQFSKHEQWSRVEEECREALGQLPERPVLHELLGVTLWQKSEREPALAEFRASAQLDPARARPHLLLGRTLSELGNLDAAAAEYRQAVHLQPNSALLHNSLGLVLFEKGAVDEAIKEYRTAIRLWPDYFEGHFNMGRAYFQKGDWAAASSKFRAAILIYPDFTEAHNNLGASLLKLGEMEAAITAFRSALRLEPGNATMHFNLALALLLKGDKQAALTEFRAASDLDPANAAFRQKLTELSGQMTK